MPSSVLLRTLADVRQEAMPCERSVDFEGPSRWLSLPQAVALHGVLHRTTGPGAAPDDGAPDQRAGSALQEAEALQHAHDALRRRLEAQLASVPDPARPSVVPSSQVSGRWDEVYRHTYRQCQRDMAQTLDAVRQRLRLALARGPAARLAVLDAALEDALSDAALPRLNTLAACTDAAGGAVIPHDQRIAALRRVLHAELSLRMSLLQALVRALMQAEESVHG